MYLVLNRWPWRFNTSGHRKEAPSYLFNAHPLYRIGSHSFCSKSTLIWSRCPVKLVANDTSNHPFFFFFFFNFLWSPERKKRPSGELETFYIPFYDFAIVGRMIGEQKENFDGIGFILAICVWFRGSLMGLGMAEAAIGSYEGHFVGWNFHRGICVCKRGRRGWILGLLASSSLATVS